jgi:L-2,4-diaminobutyric acid acetyltransferase
MTTMSSTPELRAPSVDDGAAIARLAAHAGSLDVNSSYAYVLWCRDFARTSIVAEARAQVVGFITGYLRPDQPDVLFVWQVAVDEAARGRGVGARLLDAALASEAAAGCAYLEATVTPSNASSWGLFRGLARRRGVPCREEEEAGFVAALFPDGGHEGEVLVRIGPLRREEVREASESDGKEVVGCR